MSELAQEETTMTVTAQISNPTPLLKIVLRDYEVFAGLDVDHHSIAVTFADQGKLLQSLRVPYSAMQLLNYVGISASADSRFE